MPLDLPPKRIRRLAEEALATLPEEFRAAVAECVLSLQPRASAVQRRELELQPDEEVYGLYEGHALTERHVDDPPGLPPRISIFYEPLLEDCDTEEELKREIQTTVLHEIGHHFGLDEDRLDELGYA